MEMTTGKFLMIVVAALILGVVYLGVKQKMF